MNSDSRDPRTVRSFFHRRPWDDRTRRASSIGGWAGVAIFLGTGILVAIGDLLLLAPSNTTVPPIEVIGFVVIGSASVGGIAGRLAGPALTRLTITKSTIVFLIIAIALFAIEIAVGFGLAGLIGLAQSGLSLTAVLGVVAITLAYVPVTIIFAGVPALALMAGPAIIWSWVVRNRLSRSNGA